jgi:hypothetical protein
MVGTPPPPMSLTNLRQWHRPSHFAVFTKIFSSWYGRIRLRGWESQCNCLGKLVVGGWYRIPACTYHPAGLSATHVFVKNQLDAPISQIYFVMKLYMFRTVRLSIIRSLFTVHSATVYVLQNGTPGVPSWSCSNGVYKPVRHIPLLSVQSVNSWWWTEELSETCRVSWQNKFV